MQNISDDLGVSFCETMLNSTLGGVPYVASSANNKNILGQSSQLVDKKYKKDFSVQDMRFLETTFRQYMKRFNYEFETDANMSRDELLSLPVSKKPSFFTQIRIEPRIDYQIFIWFKKRYIVRVLDKIGLGRIFLTLALLIVKGRSPTIYAETRSESELAGMRTKVIDENIKFNSIPWHSE